MHKTTPIKICSVSWLTALAIILASPAGAQPPTVSGFELNWVDEFDGNQIDNTKWFRIFSTNPTNNSLHAYLPEQVTVAGGNLIITSENQSFGGLPYRSGQVISTASQQYGRWEVRGDLPTSRGMWPAIWLLPDTNSFPWPSQGEIDIMENRGDQPTLTSSAFHYGTNPPLNHNFVFKEQQSRWLGSLVDYHSGFHRYAVEWDSDQLRFYVDDVHYHTVTDSSVGGFLSNQSAGMQLIINTAIGGNFLDNPNGTTVWPQQFLVDYVYAYARTGPPVETFENGDFEENSSLARWTLFGNTTFPNVSAEDVQWSLGQTSANIFGQFNGDNYSGIEQGIAVSPGDSLRAAAKSYVWSGDSISNTGNSLQLKIDYYKKPHGVFGSADYISSDSIVIANGSSPNNVWEANEMFSTAPAQAQSARVALVFHQPSNQNGSVFVDDVEFENLSDQQPVEVEVESASILRGIQVGGDVVDLAESDDVYMQFQPGLTLSPDEPPLWIQLEGTSPSQDPDAMEFQLETNANTGGLDQKIRVFNFSSGNYEEVDSRAATTDDSVVTITLSGDLSQYVNSADNQVKVQLTWKAEGLILLFPWQINIDQASWTITP